MSGWEICPDCGCVVALPAVHEAFHVNASTSTPDIEETS